MYSECYHCKKIVESGELSLSDDNCLLCYSCYLEDLPESERQAMIKLNNEIFINEIYGGYNK